jgi:hypothetical protein
MEYSHAEQPLTVAGKELDLRLALAREVDTDGWIASDPHIHTLTHSGHGDATVEERMATIAGEGIELPIATEHNHHADYAPHARATGTHAHFTPVIGNEVTTTQGHFNAFPVRPGSPVPDYKIVEWKELLRRIRATPGMRVVVLNHPSNVHSGFSPADPKRYHPESGDDFEGRAWEFDGIEVLTSAAMQSDWMKPYRDWFAQLNRGNRLVGLGSSDTHDVDAYILGQARTYIASKASAPDAIDVGEVCDSILAGKVLVSMGLLAEAWVDGRGVGETVTSGGRSMAVRVRVQGPRWVTADRVELFLNGQRVASRPIVHRAGVVVKSDVTLTLPRPKHDAWLVAIASGPGVTAPWWPIARPYQPTRGEWDPRVIGSTSPIWIDGDGDGKHASPREIAAGLVREWGGQPARLMERLSAYDEATAVQAASVCAARGMDLDAPAFKRAVDSAPAKVRHGFMAYLHHRPQAARPNP